MFLNLSENQQFYVFYYESKDDELTKPSNIIELPKLKSMFSTNLP